jgi:hypothetical protein
VIKLAGTVEYEGGRTEEFLTGPAAVAEWELFALRHGYPVRQDEAPPVLASLVIAHFALGVQEGFDVWRKSVVGVEMTAEGAPPTLPAVIAD